MKELIDHRYLKDSKIRYMGNKKQTQSKETKIPERKCRFTYDSNILLDETKPSSMARDIKAHIRVLDMPILDTTRTDGLIGEVISDIVLQLLSYVAEQERAFIKQRQAEGIRIAKEKGKHLGRPALTYPENWEKVYTIWKEGSITARAAMSELKLKPTSFYKLVKKFTIECC